MICFYKVFTHKVGIFDYTSFSEISPGSVCHSTHPETKRIFKDLVGIPTSSGREASSGTPALEANAVTFKLVTHTARFDNL